VYDNLASQPVMERYGTVLVSDGGGVFEEIEPIGKFALIKRIRRYTAIAQRGGGSMRREVIVGSFEHGERQGTYWGIGTPPSRYATRSDDAYPDALVDDVIEEVRTDLDAFSTAEQAVLQNHGYLQMDAAARSHLVKYPSLVPDPFPKCAPPYAEWLDPDAVRRALAASNKRKLPFGRR
jgi:NTE family protein